MTTKSGLIALPLPGEGVQFYLRNRKGLRHCVCSVLMPLSTARGLAEDLNAAQVGWPPAQRIAVLLRHLWPTYDESAALLAARHILGSGEQG